MIEVVATYDQFGQVSRRPLMFRQQATYDVLVDGQSVARYPSIEEAEAYAEQLREEAKADDTPN
jgi:hypothetical protein